MMSVIPPALISTAMLSLHGQTRRGYDSIRGNRFPAQIPHFYANHSNSASRLAFGSDRFQEEEVTGIFVGGGYTQACPGDIKNQAHHYQQSGTKRQPVPLGFSAFPLVSDSGNSGNTGRDSFFNYPAERAAQQTVLRNHHHRHKAIRLRLPAGP